MSGGEGGVLWGALRVSGRGLPALRASVLRPSVCGPCGRLEISLCLGWVPGQRLCLWGCGDPALQVGFRRRGGSLGSWCVFQFMTLRRREMA